MRTGILTFHNADNYGAVLQCYALQEALVSLGHDVSIIDYCNNFVESCYKVTPISHFIRCFIHTFKTEPWMKDQINRRIKKRKFKRFRTNYLNINPRQNDQDIPQIYDTYIIGSDQVWNECCTNEFDPIYFGNFNKPQNSKIYGYAISANQDTLNSLGINNLKTIASRFEKLSFREQKFQYQFNNLTNIEARIDIDPTLLHNKEFWDNLTNNKFSRDKYVLVYELLKNPLDKDAITRKATEFANKHGLSIIDISKSNYSVNEFVSLFKYATCVFTTSFHATVFALIFNRPLYSFKLNSVRDERYVNLLTEVNAQNAIAEFTDEPDEFPDINYQIINAKIEEMRQKSIDYLKSIH